LMLLAGATMPIESPGWSAGGFSGRVFEGDMELGVYIKSWPKFLTACGKTAASESLTPGAQARIHY